LPVSEPVALSIAPRTHQSHGSAAQSPVHVLLVEDNLVNQKVVQAILRKKGYRIEVANDGRDALAKLEGQGEAYNIVLMDVQMPVLDGLETTRIIRKDRRWDRLPIVAMTAHAMNGDRERCIQAGMNAYVSKPVQPAHLVSVIENLLDEWTHNPPPPPVHKLDRALGDRLMLDESGIANDLLEVFLQLAPERLQHMEAAASASDGSKLTAEARKIADAAEQLASRALVECAQHIELAALSRDFPAALQELETLRRGIQELAAMAAV
jgi:CheY-like chemotaxis protein